MLFEGRKFVTVHTGLCIYCKVRKKVIVHEETQSKELAKARYEKRKAEKREFTARKKAGLLTPEEQEAEEK